MNASISLPLPTRLQNTLALPLTNRQTPPSPHKPTTPSSPSPSTKRPPHKRHPSRDSPGWYNTEDGMTLDDFAQRLNTTLSRLEQYRGRCAQNLVMALMRPTPLVLFVFNPMSLVVWIVVGVVWWLEC